MTTPTTAYQDNDTPRVSYIKSRIALYSGHAWQNESGRKAYANRQVRKWTAELTKQLLIESNARGETK